MYRITCYALSTILLVLALVFANLDAAQRAGIMLVLFVNANITAKAIVERIDR